jgi:hypothetical protein
LSNFLFEIYQISLAAVSVMSYNFNVKLVSPLFCCCFVAVVAVVSFEAPSIAGGCCFSVSFSSAAPEA